MNETLLINIQRDLIDGDLTIRQIAIKYSVPVQTVARIDRELAMGELNSRYCYAD